VERLEIVGSEGDVAIPDDQHEHAQQDKRGPRSGPASGPARGRGTTVRTDRGPLEHRGLTVRTPKRAGVRHTLTPTKSERPQARQTGYSTIAYFSRGVPSMANSRETRVESRESRVESRGAGDWGLGSEKCRVQIGERTLILHFSLFTPKPLMRPTAAAKGPGVAAGANVQCADYCNLMSAERGEDSP
jgi:hypothetical protein